MKLGLTLMFGLLLSVSLPDSINSFSQVAEAAPKGKKKPRNERKIKKARTQAECNAAGGMWLKRNTPGLPERTRRGPRGDVRCY